MARKITERERLITFALTATTEQLSEAKEIIDSALRTRQPKTRKAAKKRVSHISDAMAERNPPPED